VTAAQLFVALYSEDYAYSNKIASHMKKEGNWYVLFCCFWHTTAMLLASMVRVVVCPFV